MSQADRTERLLNLLFALMASARPVPKAFLRDAIDAYRESPSDDAFERMFERDKEELRSMGVPILTVEGSDGLGGIEGYRVALDDYALPEVTFTADELAVLGLAARVWEQASLGPAAQRAVVVSIQSRTANGRLTWLATRAKATGAPSEVTR